MRSRLIRAAAFCGALASAGAAQANCDRHIYNDTPYVWHLSIDDSDGSVMIGTTFHDFCAGKEWGCDLPPHSVMGITYDDDSFGMSNSRIKLTDPTGVSRIYEASAAAGRCGKFGHDGDTGGASLNDPADGDIKIWSYAWDTSVTPPPPPGGSPGLDMRTKPMPAPVPVPEGKVRAP